MCIKVGEYSLLPGRQKAGYGADPSICAISSPLPPALSERKFIDDFTEAVRHFLVIL